MGFSQSSLECQLVSSSFLNSLFRNPADDTLQPRLLMLLGDSFIPIYLILWLLQSFHLLLYNALWALEQEVFYRCIHEDWDTQHCILIGCVFCLLENDVSLMNDEDFILKNLYYVIKDDAHLVVVDFPPITVASPIS